MLNWSAGLLREGEWLYMVGVHGEGIEAKQVLARVPCEAAATRLDFTELEGACVSWFVNQMDQFSSSRPLSVLCCAVLCCASDAQSGRATPRRRARAGSPIRRSWPWSPTTSSVGTRAAAQRALLPLPVGISYD